MNTRVLIAAGTWSYPNLDKKDQRPELRAAVGSVVELFTGRLSYRRELTEVSEGPTSTQLRDALDEWFGSPSRDASEWVVIYYTGHGKLVGKDSLYLLTADTKFGQIVKTAFSLKQFADIVLSETPDGKRRRVRKLLLIVDTCFAGEGVVNLAASLAESFRQTTGSMFYLLSATRQDQEADAGALAAALVTAIEDLSSRYVQQEFLYFDQVIPAINRRLKLQEVIYSPVASPDEEPQFFPNRNFMRGLSDSVLANEAQRAITDPEFREHWGPHSRGWRSIRSRARISPVEVAS